jgi:hypothetical protein
VSSVAMPATIPRAGWSEKFRFDVESSARIYRIPKQTAY